jgi:hypothetical protein
MASSDPNPQRLVAILSPIKLMLQLEITSLEGGPYVLLVWLLRLRSLKMIRCVIDCLDLERVRGLASLDELPTLASASFLPP